MMNILRTLSALLAFALTASAQAAKGANERYQTKDGRAAVAKGLAAPDRDERQKPAELAAAMNLRAGMTVADIGTGVGYMLPYLSRAVGPNGKVIGEDIQTDFLDQARAKITQEKLGNVDLVLGGEHDPKLVPGSLDAALILDVYHHFDYPAEMLRYVRAALRPGAGLYIVDYYRKGREDHVRLEREDAVREVEAAGFVLRSSSDHIPQEQYMLVFERP